MFTGLIEAIGEVSEMAPSTAGFRLRLATPIAREIVPGDSIAVNGVCLTAVLSDGAAIDADVSPETLRVTGLGSLRPGAIVNLERPLRADGRLGGHFVQGHVDATGTLEDIRRDGEAFWLSISYPARLAPYIVRKGSIAVDGISLTVAEVDDRRFHVQIIPYTWEHTNLGLAKSGDIVNLECDILGKYVARVAQLAGMSTRSPSDH